MSNSFNPAQIPSGKVSKKIIGLEPDARFLGRTALLFLTLAILALLFSLLTFSEKSLKSWLHLAVLTLMCLTCIIAWLNVKKGKLAGAAFLLVSAATLGSEFFFLVGSDGSFLSSLCAFMLTAVFAIITLEIRVAYIIILLGNLSTLFLWLTSGIFISKNGWSVAYRLGIDDIILVALVQITTIWLVNYLVQKLVQANQTTQAQADNLAAALADIEKKRQLGQDIGQQILIMAEQLQTTANQQATGSREQADTLGELIVYIQELTQTSETIAGEANQLRETSQTISNSTRQAKSASLEVKQMSASSAQAVKQTTERNQEVNNLYTTLNRSLSELAQSQDEIRQVIRLIQELGKQTHLLALNAAIEAAGAGEYGDRFGVVAQEVKTLADNSIEASQQVSQILGFIESRIEQAKNLAENGYSETQTALQVAQDSGVLMQQLIAIVENSNAEMEQIEKAANLMTQRAAQISFATNQQFSASKVGLEKIQFIGVIATQTATGSSQVSNNTTSLENLADQLLTTIA